MSVETRDLEARTSTSRQSVAAVTSKPDAPAITEERFEFKYRLSYHTYLRVIGALRPWAHHDEFSERGRDHRYFVRSLYFDTYDYRAYEDKITGVPNRVKLRIRSYWPEHASAQFLKYEIKTRRGNMVNKFTEIVPLALHEELARGEWPQAPGPVLEEFRRRALLLSLRPKVLVDYNREGFVPRDRRDVRITFDHSLRFAAADCVFPDDAFFRPEYPAAVVMEVKFRRERVPWLERIVRGLELRSMPNSKYSSAVEHSQHALFY